MDQVYTHNTLYCKKLKVSTELIKILNTCLRINPKPIKHLLTPLDISNYVSNTYVLFCIMMIMGGSNMLKQNATFGLVIVTIILRIQSQHYTFDIRL